MVKPEDKLIELHQTGKAVIIFREADSINGGDILPDFRMKVADVFEQ